jgi:membrane glycosyltransferase
MDGVTYPYSDLHEAMPAPAPLAMPVQDFACAPLPRGSRVPQNRKVWLWRAAAFMPALTMTVAFIWAQSNALSRGGLSWIENLHLYLSGFAFLWIAISVGTALVGLIAILRSRQTIAITRATPDLSVALLIPIHNEAPSDVFGNAAALLADLRGRTDARRFSLFILSDTRDMDIAALEWRAFDILRMEQGDAFDVFYRRRAENTDRKTGNLANWVTNWGARYDAMLVLDADSLMSADAVLMLRRELANDPSAGLVQSWPKLIHSVSLFARVQEFATSAHGWLLATGLAKWTQGEANYWGHNAIIRTRAFAQAAGLPHLGGNTLIMSHDFVEAAMLLRAGWQVRFLPAIEGSFEQTPNSLIDYVLRDRRWCRGNLQHLRILGARGLHPLSRFHMLQGAVSYLLAPVWLMLLAIWAFPDMAATSLGVNGAPPVADPIDGFASGSGVLLVCVSIMLLGPKLLSAATILAASERRRAFGGWAAFSGAVLLEVAISFIYAPILMVQQVLSVTLSAVSKRDIWAPQSRGGSQHSLRALMTFHSIETTLGAAILIGIATSAVTLWLLPVGVSLILAVPLSALSATPISTARIAALRLATPESLTPPAIVDQATIARARYTEMLAHAPSLSLAAE